ncbi:MAG: DUF928 domain-containing protein, partial [Myxococcota bacterium]|nr:DUF928 domain-containing protein [Myxococcota bacterium]
MNERTRRKWLPIAATATAVLLPAWSGAAEPEKQQKASTEKEESAAAKPDAPLMIASNMPIWVPPNRGAPPMRLGGATRSARVDPALPRIEALVPEEPGWTLEAQPVLYWYIEKPTDVPIEFGVQRVDPVKQIVKKRLKKPAKPGIQRIDLAEHGVKLEPGAIYFWFVKLVPDPNDHEQDKIVGGGIRRVSTPDALASELAKPDASRPHELAKAGIWYDAI